MIQIGRYRLRVRMLFFAPVIVGLSWWLAVQIVDLPDFQVLVEFHEANVSHYQRVAQSPIADHVTAFSLEEIALADGSIIRSARPRSSMPGTSGNEPRVVLPIIGP